MKRWITDARAGFRILCTRQFWRDFHDYWLGEGLSARLDDWTSRARENTGQDPDWKVERRRAKRRKPKP